MDISNIKKGDSIKVKIPCRWGTLRGWRKVTGNDSEYVHIKANGCNHFFVYPHEILDHK